MDKIELQKMNQAIKFFSRALYDISNHLERESRFENQPFLKSAKAYLKKSEQTIDNMFLSGKEPEGGDKDGK